MFECADYTDYRKTRLPWVEGAFLSRKNGMRYNCASCLGQMYLIFGIIFVSGRARAGLCRRLVPVLSGRTAGIGARAPKWLPARR